MYKRQGVTQKEAEDFYHNLKNPDDMMPVMFGMNSRLVKEDGKVDVYKRQSDYRLYVCG